MSIFTYQGLGLNYRVAGEGRPVLFLHGLGGDLRQCQTLLETVGNIRKVMMDVRGHGETSLGPADALNFAQFAEDAAALMEHLGIRRFVAGGISMGSGIALRLALAFPELVTALILVRPAWLDVPYPPNLKEHVLIGNLLRKETAQRAREAFAGSAEYQALKASAPASAASLLGQFDDPLAGERANRLIRIPGSVPFSDLRDLEAIDVDTLVLAAPCDPAHPLTMARALASRIRRSRFAEVTSKSEDVQRHLADCACHINRFLGGISERRNNQGRPREHRP